MHMNFNQAAITKSIEVAEDIKAEVERIASNSDEITKLLERIADSLEILSVK